MRVRLPRSLRRQAAAPGRVGVLAMIGALTVPGDSQAQQPVRLGEPEAVAAEPRGSIAGIRVLPGGSVLVADGAESRLVRLSPDLSRATVLGREGQGPDEYRQPDALFALPGDSTLMTDLGNGRLAVLAPDGAIVRTAPIAREGEDGSMLLVLPQGTDAEGGVWFASRGGPRAGLEDSLQVRRLDPATGTVETMARLAPPPVSHSSSGGEGRQEERVMPVPFGPEDAWAVGPGGLAIARAEPYRVERVRPDGSRIAGPQVAWEPVEIRRADQEEWLAALSGGLMVMVTEENGVRSTNFRRGGRPPGMDIDAFDWPDRKPAFAPRGAAVDFAGRLWVRRHVRAGAPALYDVFGSDGQLSGQVELPPGRRLVGFSRDYLYLSRTDELDFQWLEKYPEPTVTGAD